MLSSLEISSTVAPGAGVWTRPVEGFLIKERGLQVDSNSPDGTGREVGPWLVPVSPRTEDYGVRSARELLRDWVDLVDNRDYGRLLRFANAYGPLWPPDTFLYTSRLDARREGNLVLRPIDSWAEPIPLWDRELDHARPLLDLSRLVVKSRYSGYADEHAEAELRSWVLVDQDIVRFQVPGTYSLHVILPMERPGSVFRDWPLAEVAAYFLAMRINMKLAGQFDLRLLPLHGSVLRYFPQNLLAEIYTRFALGLSRASGEQGICQKCGRPFTGRRGQQYCGEKCRDAAKAARAYAKKKRSKQDG